MNKSEGRRRLQIVLGTLGGVVCVAMMAIVLKIYGSPYDPRWWWVMAGILIAAILAPRVLARPVEWIVDGYCGVKGTAPGDAGQRT